MADPKLTIVIEQKGADGVVKSLKEIQKVGDTTYTKIIKDGQIYSESTKTITGAVKSQKGLVTDLNQGYSLLTSLYRDLKRPMDEVIDLALKDQESMIKRNTAVLAHKDATQQDIDKLEAQVKSLQRTKGVADDYTRGIQEQLAVQGLNTDQIERGTRAVIGLSEATGKDAIPTAQAFTRFMKDQTDSIKGTTIKLKDNKDEQSRWQAVEKISATGMQELTDKARENIGQMNLARDSWSEFKESIGRLFTTKPAIEQIGNFTNALNSISDWIDKHQSQISGFLDNLARLGAASAFGAPGVAVEGARQELNRLRKGKGPSTGAPATSPRGIHEQAFVLGLTPGGAGTNAFLNYMDATWANAAANPIDQYGRSMGGYGGNRRNWWDRHGSDYTQVASGFIGGGAQGGLSALGSLAGNALLPGLGGILGGLLGGGIGKLFGGHKKRQGETPAQPIYTSDMNLQRLVTDLLNVTKMSIVRGASGGIDAGVKMLNAQNARAGV